MSQPLNHSFNQLVNQLFSLPINQSTNQSAYQWTMKSIYQSKSVNQLVLEGVYQTVMC